MTTPAAAEIIITDYAPQMAAKLLGAAHSAQSEEDVRFMPSLDAPGTKAVVAQIKQRFQDFQTAEGTEKERLFGDGCDGNMQVFVCYRGGKQA